MSDSYSVRSEPDFSPVYTEDESVEVRKGDLRAVLDALVNSLDFGSGFLDNEQVEAMRAAAVALDIDPVNVTPRPFQCTYYGHQEWVWTPHRMTDLGSHWRCTYCQLRDFDRPAPEPSFDGQCVNCGWSGEWCRNLFVGGREANPRPCCEGCTHGTTSDHGE